MLMVSFRKDVVRQEQELDYQKVAQELYRRVKEAHSNLISSNLKHDLRQLIFASYASKFRVVIRPGVAVVNLTPVRALILLDEVICFVSKKKMNLIDILEYKLLHLVLERKKVEESSINGDYEFFWNAIDAVFWTSQTLLEEEFDILSSLIRKLIHKMKKSMEIRSLQQLKGRLQSLFNSGNFQMSTISKLISEDQNDPKSRRSSSLVSIEKRSEIDDLIESYVCSLDAILSKMKVLLQEIDSEEARLSLLRQVEENFLFKLTAAISLGAAVTTFGVFISGMFTMMFSVPDQMAAGGSWPNSLPVDQYNQTFISPFLPITLSLVAIVFIGGPLLFCYFLKFGVNAFMG